MEPSDILQKLAARGGQHPTAAYQVLLQATPAWSRTRADIPDAFDALLALYRRAVGSGAPAQPVVGGHGYSARDRRGRRARTTTAAATEPERKAAAEFAKRIASDAARHPTLLAYRNWLWGGETALSPSSARALLASPALAVMSRDELRAASIPVAGHTATLTPIGAGSDGWRDGKLRITWEGGKHVEPRRVRELCLAWSHPDAQLQAFDEFGTQGVEFLEFPGATGHGRESVAVMPGSVLDGARRWAATTGLASPFRAWHFSALGAEPAAVWFLLTGIAPSIPPISVTRELLDPWGGAVTVTALPFVSRASVATALKKAMKLPRGRPATARTLASVLFVDREKDANGGKIPTWRSLATRFSVRYPHWPTTFSDLRKTYVRAKERDRRAKEHALSLKRRAR